MISFLLLGQRLIFLIVLIINFFANDMVDSFRLTMNSVGVAIHLILIGTLFLKNVYFWQIIHAPLIMLSFMTFLANSIVSFESD
jgi:hypothetical protein